ncbi:MAG TPA: hypothetical protein VFJ74_14315 [Gemmatimonadaceae bacterium]|nr:hypothetical protein [Gemmatimonadaceae bacterium]
MSSDQQPRPTDVVVRDGDAKRGAFRGSANDEYYYRRDLERPEVMTAVGIGVGVGVAAFYVARLLLQRTPLDRPRRGRGGRRSGGGPSSHRAR